MSGGIMEFAVKPETVTNWVLSRPFQCRFLEALTLQCGATHSMFDPKKLSPAYLNKKIQCYAW